MTGAELADIVGAMRDEAVVHAYCLDRLDSMRKALAQPVLSERAAHELETVRAELMLSSARLQAVIRRLERREKAQRHLPAMIHGPRCCCHYCT